MKGRPRCLDSWFQAMNPMMGGGAAGATGRTGRCHGL